jgi:hypothetical protein
MKFRKKHKSHIPINAFSIINDSITNRAFLVQHGDTNKWMLPGGNIDRGEEPEYAARRELKEESGFEHIPLTFCFSNTNTHFFSGVFNFGKLGHDKRGKIFNTRKYGETIDFGFYNYNKKEVQTYSGIPKKDQQLRSGTSYPLHRFKQIKHKKSMRWGKKEGRIKNTKRKKRFVSWSW